MISKVKNFIQKQLSDAFNIYVLPYVDENSTKCLWSNIRKGDLVILKATMHNSRKKYGIVITSPESVISKYHVISEIVNYKKRKVVRVMWNYNGRDFNNLEYCDNLLSVQRKNG